MPTLYPQCLSARINKWRHVDTGTESNESFDIRVDEDSDLDSLSKSEKAIEAKPKVSVPCHFNGVGISDYCLLAYKVH